MQKSISQATQGLMLGLLLQIFAEGTLYPAVRLCDHELDIFTILETWLDSSVDNTMQHSYSRLHLLRQDCGPHKPSGSQCGYIKENFKVSPMENISSVPDYGFQQLWQKVQSHCSKSFLKVILYLYSLSSTKHTIKFHRGSC